MAKKNKNTKKVEFVLDGYLKRSTEIYNDKSFLNGLAEDAAAQIKRRTQLKKGVSNSGGLTTLKGLKPSYIEVRQKNRGNLDANARPARSNLTATGQMLNALRGRYRQRSIEIDFEREERGPSLTGQIQNVKNSDIVGFQKKQGRRFFDLADSEVNGLRRKIADRIRKLLEK